MNKVIFGGNLCKDIELRHSLNGVAFINNTLAIKSKSATKTDFVDIVIFNKLAEIASQYLSKGDKIVISGELSTNIYTDKEGITRTGFNVIVDELEMLNIKEKKKKKKNAEDIEQSSNTEPAKKQLAEKYEAGKYEDEIPF